MMGTEMTRMCAHCATGFATTRPNKAYCSPRCRSAASRARRAAGSGVVVPVAVSEVVVETTQGARLEALEARLELMEVMPPPEVELPVVVEAVREALVSEPVDLRPLEGAVDGLGKRLDGVARELEVLRARPAGVSARKVEALDRRLGRLERRASTVAPVRASPTVGREVEAVRGKVKALEAETVSAVRTLASRIDELEELVGGVVRAISQLA